MTMPTAEIVLPSAKERKSRGVTARILTRAWSYKEMKIAAAIFLAMALFTVLGPWVIDASATKMSVANKFLPPIFMEGGKLPHFLGTDQLGRDLLLRSLIGLRNAFAIGVVSVLGMFFLGCAIGIYAGYRGGWVDVVLMRLTDVQMSIPVIILASWPVYARVSRGVTLAERQKEYVRAAKILGASDLRIMVRHIAPSILPSIAFVAVLDVARMMIFEAIFGFIGIGIQPPTPTFGTIIASGTQYLLNAWWITIVPGILLALALGSLNLMGGVLERARNHILQGGQ
jgi:peptide/nickel transport system permease protein